MFAPLASAAQITVTTGSAELKIGGYFQGQLLTTSVDSHPQTTDMIVRRARLVFDLKLNDFLSARLQPSYDVFFSGIQDAYVRLTFAPQARVTLGQFKRPFDVFALTSSTQILVIERSGLVPGVNTCGGGILICSYGVLSGGLRYSSRDLGAMIDGSLGSSRVRYAFAVTNGAGIKRREENGTKSFTGRLAVSLPGNLAVSGQIGVHDFINDVREINDYASAWALDADWGSYERGLHVKAGVLSGQNWRNLTDEGAPRQFAAVQGIATYKHLLGGDRRVYAIEPVFRVSVSEMNGAGGDGVLYTPGVVFYFVGRTKFAVNSDIWSPDEGDSQWSLRAQMYFRF
jgi:hypothetical protein